MARTAVKSPTLMPTRKVPSPMGRRGYDDPLAALALEISAKIGGVKPTSLTGHGKPVGGIPTFGERRAPARRAAYRTPPR